MRSEGRSEPLAIVRLIAHGRREARHCVPVLDGDDLGDHHQRCQHWVDVLLDEAGNQHLIGEGSIDAEGLRTSQSLQFGEAADGGNALADQGHRFRARPGAVHGEDLARDVYRSFG
jgi:hypothetical protein